MSDENEIEKLKEEFNIGIEEIKKFFLKELLERDKKIDRLQKLLIIMYEHHSYGKLRSIRNKNKRHAR